MEDARKAFGFAEEFDGLLTYCYIDQNAGMTFDVLCPACYSSTKYAPIVNKDVRFIVRYDALAESEATVAIMADVDKSEFATYINDVHHSYGHIGELATVRGIKEIDHLRFPNHPDDIPVFIIKDGNNPEGVWVRTSAIREGSIVGCLLNEPNVDFGIHSGEEIVISFSIDENGQYIAYCEC